MTGSEEMNERDDEIGETKILPISIVLQKNVFFTTVSVTDNN